MPAPRLAPGDIPQKAMTYILQGLRTIRYGEIVLVAQDGVLMQVEWSEKRRLDCWQESEDGENSYTERALADLAARIRKDFGLLQYGKLAAFVIPYFTNHLSSCFSLLSQREARSFFMVSMRSL